MMFDTNPTHIIELLWLFSLLLCIVPWLIPFLFHAKGVFTIYQTTKLIPHLEVNLKMLILHSIMLSTLAVCMLAELVLVLTWEFH